MRRFTCRLVPLQQQLTGDKCCVFNVGDIVRGTPCGEHNYNITNERMTRGRIISVHSASLVTVVVLEQDSGRGIGEGYEVEPKYFELVQVAEESCATCTRLKLGDLLYSMSPATPIEVWESVFSKEPVFSGKRRIGFEYLKPFHDYKVMFSVKEDVVYIQLVHPLED